DDSIAHFHSRAIDLVTLFAMFIGGLNFSLPFTACRNTSLLTYIRDPEARIYIIMVVVVSLFVAACLLFYGTYTVIPEAVLAGAFTAVSIGTTTGMTVADFSVWPAFLPLFLLLGCFVGGCAGSTTAGMKVIRFMLLS